MEIVFVFDSNYIKLFNICVKTVLRYNPEAHITIVSTEDLDLPFDIVKMDLPKGLKHRENDRITDATYLKLHLPKLPYDKVIFMDCDMICQGSLKELWEMDCDFINLCESHNYSKKQAEELGHKKYGNTGLMVMNLKELRKINFTEECFKKFDIPVSLWCHEESILNYSFYDKLKFIDKKYNYCHNREYDEPIDEKDAVIIHYIGAKNKKEMLERSKYE